MSNVESAGTEITVIYFERLGMAGEHNIIYGPNKPPYTNGRTMWFEYRRVINMGKGKKIDFTLFDDELKTIINLTTKIFPITYEDVINNLNTHGYEYGRIISGERKKRDI